jgi:serine/threonine-protein kinase RsbW
MTEKNSILVLYSRASEFSKLEQFIEKISDDFNIGHTYFSNIIVSLSELVKNAMIHGNNGNPRKKVIIEFENRDGRLFFTVTDQGKGFQFPLPDLNDLHLNPNIKTGLLIVQSLSDGIEFNSTGNGITIFFNIAAANELLSKSRINAFSQTQIKEKHK